MSDETLSDWDDTAEAGPVPKNRWTRAIDRSPRVGTALTGFGAHLIGSLLLIGAMFLLMPGLLLAVGSMGSGWQGHLTGAALMALGVVLFAVGRWLSDEYAVQRRS